MNNFAILKKNEKVEESKMYIYTFFKNKSF